MVAPHPIPLPIAPQTPQRGEGVQELVEFCRTRGRRVFPGWSPADLERWLIWHAERKGLIYVRAAGRIVGMAAGRREGERFTFERLVAIRPGVAGQLVREWQQRNPEWRTWQLFRHCGPDKLKPVDERWLERVATLL